MRRFVARIVGALMVVSGATFVSVVVAPSAAFAYNRWDAASYAEYYWNLRNPNYRSYSADCANFVSQSLHDPYGGGHFSYVGGPDDFGEILMGTSDNHEWWMHWDPTWGFSASRSWASVPDFYQFLQLHNPGGTYMGSAHTQAQQQATYTPNNVNTGDVLFYDWDSNGVLDHTAIQVGWGTDPTSGWYGNYINQHTTDRRHAFWSLMPYNSQWPSTTIKWVHIWDSNN
jgi:hypothetical protein